VDFGSGVLIIPAGGQQAKFLNEPPFNVLSGRNPFLGTLTFTSNVPVSVIALRGLYNERATPDFLVTTLPITDLSAAAATGQCSCHILPRAWDGRHKSSLSTQRTPSSTARFSFSRTRVSS
jgi:hypothetical protein